LLLLLQYLREHVTINFGTVLRASCFHVSET
jgi:hypothetical protein